MSGGGAVAAGSQHTVQAGMHAFDLGGNAVDAAVASTLMACVAEPLLTGLGGGGLAVVKMGSDVKVCDLFSTFPGSGGSRGERSAMDVVTLDFGPTLQTFRVGAPSVAPPGMPGGLHALHRRYGKVDLPLLAQPAIRMSIDGVPVTGGFERVCKLLWPIQQRDPQSAHMFGPSGYPLRAGDRFFCPSLGETISRFANEEPTLFTTGDLGRSIVDTVNCHALLNQDDLVHCRPRFSDAIRYQYNETTTVWLPGPPSCAGLLVLKALRLHQNRNRNHSPMGVEEVLALIGVMSDVERVQGGDFLQNLFRSGFVDQFLKNLDQLPSSDPQTICNTDKMPGNTTHISVVDSLGNAIGITQSLGETAGLVVPGTGLLLNNFLGEDDVNPSQIHHEPGDRLMTMCCPCIVETKNGLFVMGSGGSSRIRSAILHGIVYLVEHGMAPGKAAAAPRAHVEQGAANVESDGRPPGVIRDLQQRLEGLRVFEGPNMYFGGLHIAGRLNGEFVGGGDKRRSGAFGSSPTGPA